MSKAIYDSLQPVEDILFSLFSQTLQVHRTILRNDNNEFEIFVVAPCILKSTQFTNQQMHYLLTFWRRNYFFFKF